MCYVITPLLLDIIWFYIIILLSPWSTDIWFPHSGGKIPASIPKNLQCPIPKNINYGCSLTIFRAFTLNQMGILIAENMNMIWWYWQASHGILCLWGNQNIYRPRCQRPNRPPLHFFLNIGIIIQRIFVSRQPRVRKCPFQEPLP